MEPDNQDQGESNQSRARNYGWAYALAGVVVGATIAILAMWLGGWKMTKVVVKESTTTTETTTAEDVDEAFPYQMSPPGAHNPAETRLEAFFSLLQYRKFDDAYALISDGMKARAGNDFETFKEDLTEGLDQGAFENVRILSSSQEGNMYHVKWESDMVTPYTARLIQSDGKWYIDSLGEEMDKWNEM